MLIMLVSVMCLQGCDELYEIPEAVYLIKEGQHKSNVQGSLPGNGLRSLKSERLAFTARFDRSAIYNLGDDDQYDINKLFGFSDCNSHHQTNSARFGWTYNLKTEMVDIYAYVYSNGDRKIKKLGAARIGETKQYVLAVSEGHFQFSFDNTVEEFERGASCSTGLYYMLYPYFGGNRPAPHDITIAIKE